MAAPKGNNFAGNALVARKALERALELASGHNLEPDPKSRMGALVDIWKVQIAKALEGDNDSTKFIVERLDGKAHQVVMGPEEDGAHLFHFTWQN